MDEAKDEEATDWYLTSRIMTTNFAAIHTTSMVCRFHNYCPNHLLKSLRKSFTHAFYCLAACPEYMKPLREEVEEVVQREGWTKAALDQMYKIDSLIKESQRFHPLGIRKPDVVH
jgi:hypothetical protein